MLWLAAGRIGDMILTFKIQFNVKNPLLRILLVLIVNSDAKSFSILHGNIRCLSKNQNLLEELLRSLDIRGITDTKLGEKSISTVNIKGYNFFHPDSPTNAGGAAFYM